MLCLSSLPLTVYRHIIACQLFFLSNNRSCQRLLLAQESWLSKGKALLWFSVSNVYSWIDFKAGVGPTESSKKGLEQKDNVLKRIVFLLKWRAQRGWSLSLDDSPLAGTTHLRFRENVGAKELWWKESVMYHRFADVLERITSTRMTWMRVSTIDFGALQQKITKVATGRGKEIQCRAPLTWQDPDWRDADTKCDNSSRARLHCTCF